MLQSYNILELGFIERCEGSHLANDNILVEDTGTIESTLGGNHHMTDHTSTHADSSNRISFARRSLRRLAPATINLFLPTEALT